MRISTLLVLSLTILTQCVLSAPQADSSTPAPPPPPSPPLSPPLIDDDDTEPNDTVGGDNECSEAKQAPAFIKTKQAMLGVKSSILHIVGALVSEEPSHHLLIAAASYQLEEADRIRKEAKLDNLGDTHFLRRQYYRIKLKKLGGKVQMTRAWLAVGVPSWPWLGNLVSWVSDTWNVIKGGFKHFFHIKPTMPKEPVKVVPIIDIEKDLKEKKELREKANAFTTMLKESMDDIDDAIKEMENNRVC